MKQEPHLSAFELKEQGNRLYQMHRYDDAIEAYNRAIIRNPSVPAFFTNRALCYLKLQSWELAAQDCRRALDMDTSLIKAHFFLGQSLVELSHFDEAIKHLQRANDLAKDQRLNFGEEISYQLRMAKKRRWSIMEEKRISEEIELQSYLSKLIEKDRAEKIKFARGAIASAVGVGLGADGDVEELSAELAETLSLDPEQAKVEAKIHDDCDRHLAELESLFAQLDDRRKKRDVPDVLCGKISFEIMRNPVVTPSGITYDRKDIEDHLQRVGHFDPVTRHPLTQDQLTPNLAIKEVVDTFLAENEWAHYY